MNFGDVCCDGVVTVVLRWCYGGGGVTVLLRLLRRTPAGLCSEPPEIQKEFPKGRESEGNG
jgi:hypothetical protein